MNNPTVRLVGRAIMAALLTALTSIQQGGENIAWQSVAVGAGLALLEVLTPLNAQVGLAKKP